MHSDHKDNIVFLALIAGRKQQRALLAALSETGIHLLNATYGKGTVKASYLQNTLGLLPEENKVVITCVLTRDKSNVILEMLTDRFHFDSPNTGIAFTMPIDSLSF